MNILNLKVTDFENNIIKNNRQISDEIKDRVEYKNKVCIKPWGYEFLAYESNKIGVWYLNIKKGHGTSLHTHFKKDTFVIVISGTAKLVLVNNEVISLGPMSSVHIPKNKFHALSSFSDEVFLMEIEIFDKDVSFTNKNDLLRIDDQYSRKKTGYESSVNIETNNLDKFNYFWLDTDLNININDTIVNVKQYNPNINLSSQYNILLSGEIFMNGIYMKEGSLIKDFSTDILTNDALILSIENIYSQEDSKIIYSMEHLSAIMNKLNKNNKKIRLTSGCYDIIHVGHLHTLKEAKKEGDILMVCLSNDEQIRKLKGEKRPINNYKDRINLIKTFSYVDYIILYNEINIEKEETLGNIMKLVSPNCWVKGNDYTIEAILDKHPYLNKVVLIDNIENKSTTDIINKINNT